MAILRKLVNRDDMGFEELALVEIVGYVAMTTVLLSFLMKSITLLRLVNSFGCLLFVFYGFLLSPISKPIIITNTAILAINLFYLMKRTK